MDEPAQHTDEDDEFARLLAQLNGTTIPPAAHAAPAPQAPVREVPAPEPVSASPTFTPPAFSPPTYAPPTAPTDAPVVAAPLTAAPAAAAPVVAPPSVSETEAPPAPLLSAPVPASAAPTAIPAPEPVPAPAPAPVAAAPRVVAPAFGSSDPQPTTTSSARATVTDGIPVVTARTPELLGADELAAPPVPAAQPAPATPGLAQPVPASSTTAPAMSNSPDAGPSAAPIPAAASAPVSAMAASAPLDFAALLASTPGTVAPVTGPSDDDEPDIGRSTIGERIILVLAIVLPPIGLIAAIVAAVGSSRRRGWVIGLLRAALAIGVVLTLVVAVAGYLGYSALQQQLAHDRTAAASAAFCSTIKAQPTMKELPTFGWPAVAGSIPDSLTAMQAYEDRWTKLAKDSPAGIRSDVTKVATAAKKIIDAVTVSRTVDDASNVAVMSEVASSSGVPGWYSAYCS